MHQQFSGAIFDKGQAADFWGPARFSRLPNRLDVPDAQAFTANDSAKQECPAVPARRATVICTVLASGRRVVSESSAVGRLHHESGRMKPRVSSEQAPNAARSTALSAGDCRARLRRSEVAIDSGPRYNRCQPETGGSKDRQNIAHKQWPLVLRSTNGTVERRRNSSSYRYMNGSYDGIERDGTTRPGFDAGNILQRRNAPGSGR